MDSGKANVFANKFLINESVYFISIIDLEQDTNETLKIGLV
jgi:hypothetical protein